MTTTRVPLALFVGLLLALSPAAAQTAPSVAAGEVPALPTPWKVTVSLSADAGHDRFGNLTVQHGPWQFKGIDWTSPSGDSALSALLVGRRATLSRAVDLTVLAGPWYSYENHAWNELAVGTHLGIHGRRFDMSCTNYWGSALRRSGYFFDVHSQTLIGLPHLPAWLGASLEEENVSGDGLTRLFPGVLLRKARGGMTLSATPYWDVQRRTIDVKVEATFSYAVREAGERRALGANQ